MTMLDSRNRRSLARMFDRLADRLDDQTIARMLAPLDRPAVRHALEKLDEPAVRRVLDVIDRPSFVVGTSLALAALLARKHTESAIAIGAAAPLAIGVCNLLERTMRERRPRLRDNHPEQSFPSTHAAGIGALALAVVANSGAWWAAPFALGAKLSVDAARVAKREHWPHDVLWGDLIGVGAAVAAAGAARLFGAWRRHAKARRAAAAQAAVPLAQRRRARARGTVPPLAPVVAS